MGDRPPLPADPVNQQATTMNGQTGISVGHENLLVGATFDKPHLTGRFSSRQRLGTVTNLVTEYT